MPNKIKINEHVFDMVNHESAYWLGFLAADGNVYKNRITLRLSSKDADHVFRFKKFLDSEHTIYQFTTKLKGKSYGISHISFRSSRIVDALAIHNIVANKSSTLQLSRAVPDEYMNSYLLGLFDGDGCIFYNGPNKIGMNLISSNECCEQVQKLLIEKCGVKQTKLRPYNHMSYLVFQSKTDVAKICSFLYSGAKVWLPRKKEKAVKFFERHHNDSFNIE